MPEATPFMALGVGNGFPFCFRELAVKPVNGSLGMTSNDYNNEYGDDFSTIGSDTGFSRGKLDPEYFADLYWNLYSFKASASVSYTYTVNDGNGGTNTVTDSGSVSDIQMNRTLDQEPRERVCYKSHVEYESTDTTDQESRIRFGPIYYFENEDGSKEYYLSFEASIRVAVEGSFRFSDGFQPVHFDRLDPYIPDDEETFESVWEGVMTIDGIELDIMYVMSDFEPNSITAAISLTDTTFYTYPNT